MNAELNLEKLNLKLYEKKEKLKRRLYIACFVYVLSGMAITALSTIPYSKIEELEWKVSTQSKEIEALKTQNGTLNEENVILDIQLDECLTDVKDLEYLKKIFEE